MRAEKQKPDRSRFEPPPRMMSMLVAGLLFLATVAWVQPTQAAPPLAGTSIGNQASATYTDASSVQRTATSNTVQTIVQQVAGLTLDATQSKAGAPGGTVYFPHTLTNTGNGSDTFALATSGASGFGNIAIYPDANGDGVPDNYTPITTSGPLAAGSSFKFIVAATIPPAATDGATATVNVTATSVFTPATTESNTDTANVSGKAIIAMTKSVSPGSGNPGAGPVTYTLTYTNTGNSTAASVKITDVIPAGMTYRTGDLARWSVTGVTVLTDADKEDKQSASGNGITYDFGVTTPNTVTATIDTVLPGETRTLTFAVDVTAGAAPGIVNNKADFTYDDGSGTPKTGSTNTTPFTVNQIAAVVANDGVSPAVVGSNDTIAKAAVPQGSTVSFPVTIWNTGNGTDSFDITIPARESFPLGTSFVLYKTDGVTPLIDTNSNSTPDTGPLAPGDKYVVTVKAILPAGATSLTPVTTILNATSKQDSTKSDPVTLQLNAITANTVDLTLNKAVTGPDPAADGNKASTGFGSGLEAIALMPHNLANPGTTTPFVLKVNNTSPNADTYNLAASSVTDFGSTTLPPGWTVTFKADGGAGDCSTLGAVISNTGVINAGTYATVCAIVSVPSNAVAGQQDIAFRALSPSSSAHDPMLCAVDVNTIRAISVTNNQTGQVFPGGTVVYPMTVTNNGNITEGTVAKGGTLNGSNSIVELGLSDSLLAQGWTSVVYYDANGNGVIDAGEPVVTDLSFSSNGALGLASGESVPLLVKVFAPAGAATGDTNVTILTATTTGDRSVIVGNPATQPPPVSSATDTSTVISGQVTLTKTQALDATCDGTSDTGTFVQGNITTGAIPGACILYKVTATNRGTANVTSLVVSDAIPTNTVYNKGASCFPTLGSPGTHSAAVTPSGSITSEATECSDNGTISASVPTLVPGASVDLTFGVQIKK